MKNETPSPPAPLPKGRGEREFGEFALIRDIRTAWRTHPRVRVGPGDDCAVLNPSAAETLVTTDLLMDGVDFILAEVGAYAAGRKAMGANLSDIAAMAGIPTGAVVSVAIPQGRGAMSLARELLRGLADMANEFGVPIVGGDTNSWANPLAVSVTMLGEPNPHTGPVLRSGAKVGDRIFVTGPCGGSILGRHLEPRPRIRQALQLAACVRLTAMIDISDGLAADLGHILEASGVGAELIAEALPVHDDAQTLAQRTGREPLDHALNDGEDFELVFTVPEADAPAVVASRLGFEIGRIVAQEYSLIRNGVREVLVPQGWAHDL